MLLSTPVTEAAPAEVTTEFEDDPAITKETLASQLHEMEKVMENLGLEPKPETGVAASSGKPPSGFVQAEAMHRGGSYPNVCFAKALSLLTCQ